MKIPDPPAAGASCAAVPPAAGASCAAEMESDPPEQPSCVWGVGWRGTECFTPYAEREAWDSQSGLDRLAGLENRERLDPPQPPPGWPLPKTHEGFLELQNDYLWTTVAPEVIQDRLDLYYKNEVARSHPPPWMTLMPQTDISNWSLVLQNEILLEPFAIGALRDVINFPRYGTYEANRIIAHLLKDSDSVSSYRCGRRASRWCYKCCNEALAAMRQWQDWDYVHQRSLGLVWTQADAFGKKWHWSHPSSSSSSSWSGYESSAGSSSSRSQSRHRGWR